jgi:outer membrane protein assembly factor BamD (BamD/ComL family)
LNSIGSLNPEKEQKKEETENPARKDYTKGRELYTAGKYSEAAISFHNALKGFEEQG